MLRCQPEERQRFLDEVCRGDDGLRVALVSLLTNYQEIAARAHGPSATQQEVVSPLTMPYAESLVGRTLHQYAITAKLGQGGMGTVYLARDTRLGRLVAIKALSRQYAQDPQRRERLRREARAAAALSYPGIAIVYALEEFDDDLYIVSEYVAGHTLRQEVAQGPLSCERLVDTGVEIAKALSAAHRRGVVHRDLKPENVMRTHDGMIKVLDFGLALVRIPDEASETHLTDAGSVVGTPGYMAPEQVLGRESDFRVDLFAFGVLAYELASGVHPFATSSVASTIARVLEVDPPQVTNLNTSCPPALAAVIHRCLEKDRSRRYDSTDELVHALQSVRSGSSRIDLVQPPANTLWWWQFHQALVGSLYYLLLIPLWLVQEWTTGISGGLVFLGGVLTAGIAATLRFHLWFVSCFNATELVSQHERLFWWIRIADLLFVIVLLGASALVVDLHLSMTAGLVTAAVGSFLAFTIFEPAAARTAFPEHASRRLR